MKRYIRKEREPNLTHYTNTNTKHLQNHTKHERQDPGCPALRTEAIHIMYIHNVSAVRDTVCHIYTQSLCITLSLFYFLFLFSPLFYRYLLCLSLLAILSDFLDTHIYLTRGWKDNQAFAIMLREGDEADAITGLQAKTHFGRPDWAKEFDSISLSHAKLVYSIYIQQNGFWWSLIMSVSKDWLPSVV